MPRQPRQRTSRTTTVAAANDVTTQSTTGTTSLSSVRVSLAETQRAARYDVRQERVRTTQRAQHMSRMRDAYAEMAEQSRRIQQYVVDHHDGNDNDLQLQPTLDTAEQLIRNLDAMRQWRTIEYEGRVLELRNSIELLLRKQREFQSELVRRGENGRSTRYILRQFEEDYREQERGFEELEQMFIEEGESMVSFQQNIRQVMQHCRERERYSAVRSAFLEPTTILGNSKNYRTAKGRIQKSVCTGAAGICLNRDAERQSGTCDMSSCTLSASFGGDDVLPIENGTPCVICCYEYCDGDEICRNGISETRSRCNHLFHYECITSWIEASRKAECPCCRQPFIAKSL